MNSTELQDIIKVGETSRVQFKRELGNQSKIAAEMIAFSNSNGGMLIFGVLDKTGEIAGLSYEELQKANNELANIANELVKPLIYITTEAVIVDAPDGKKNILVAHIEEGISKPYKDLNGTIWLKQGAGTQLFQSGGKFYADKSVVPETTEKDIRNSLLASYCSKLINYRGFGSGITRAISNQPNTELINYVEGEQFIVRIPRAS